MSRDEIVGRISIMSVMDLLTSSEALDVHNTITHLSDGDIISVNGKPEAGYLVERKGPLVIRLSGPRGGTYKIRPTDEFGDIYWLYSSDGQRREIIRDIENIGPEQVPGGQWT